jgi:hypothetical protein
VSLNQEAGNAKEKGNEKSLKEIISGKARGEMDNPSPGYGIGGGSVVELLFREHGEEGVAKGRGVNGIPEVVLGDISADDGRRNTLVEARSAQPMEAVVSAVCNDRV